MHQSVILFIVNIKFR